MKSVRGGTHSTLTETAQIVVKILEKTPGVNMISPGIITKRTSRDGTRRVIGVFTNAGMELSIAGQSVQKVAVHCNSEIAPHIFLALSLNKKLGDYTFKTRARKPGV